MVRFHQRRTERRFPKAILFVKIPHNVFINKTNNLWCSEPPLVKLDQMSAASLFAGGNEERDNFRGNSKLWEALAHLHRIHFQIFYFLFFQQFLKNIEYVIRDTFV